MQQEKRSIGAVLVEALLGLFARLPLKFHLGFGRFLSWLMRDVIHYRRDVVMTNLSRSFPEMKYGELKDLMKSQLRALKKGKKKKKA